MQLILTAKTIILGVTFKKGRQVRLIA